MLVCRPVRTGFGVTVNRVISVGLSASQDRQWCEVSRVISVGLSAGPRPVLLCMSAELSVLVYRPAKTGCGVTVNKVLVGQPHHVLV